jgi:DHA1 family multidrug resistance protein-like MFS transporter
MALLTRRQARLLLPLGTAIALSLTGDSTLYAVLPNQTAVVGISLGAVGVMLGANRLIRIPGNLLAGMLNDRLGRRRLFLLGLFLGILSTLSYSFVRGFWPLLAARLLWGIAWALINVGGYTMVLDWSTSADRGRVSGFYQVAYMVGLAISPILGGPLTDALGFRTAVRICAAVSAVGLVVAYVALPEIPPPGQGLTAGRASLHALVGMLRRIDRRILVAGYIYLVVFFVGNGVLMSTISFYLGQRWGTSFSLGGVAIGVSSLAGVMLALRAALGILGGPVAGILSDRQANRWPVVRVAILAGVAGFAALALSSGVWALPVGVALVSLSAGALIAVLAAVVGDQAAGWRAGTAMGGVATAGDIGSAAGPLFAYALASAWGLRWVYLFSAAALLSCLLVTVDRRMLGSRRASEESELAQ